MRSIQTQYSFPLASVKPLERLLDYRQRCLDLTRQVLQGPRRRREKSPLTGAPLKPFGKVEDLEYSRCPESNSLFLSELPDWKAWANLLAQVGQIRHSPGGLHLKLAQSRTDHVYAPKIEWIQEALRLQGLKQPRVLEAVTSPSDLSHLLRDSGSFSEVVTLEEMTLIHSGDSAKPSGTQAVEVAVLMESLDRVDDPAGLLNRVASHLVEGGLLFVTGLVSSGFDMAVLGLHNLYLYPPDRANCFSLQGLRRLLEENGFSLLEVSTPGVLDVEIVRAHAQLDPSLALSPFEQQLIDSDEETRGEFQTFLQQRGLSSFARMVARKRP